MRWLRHAGLLMLVLVLAAAGFMVMTAHTAKRPIGFQMTQAVDAAGTPFVIGVWYPTDAQPWPTTLLGPTLMNVAKDGAIAGTALPLVVLSHGNGAGATAHVDLAFALAEKGYVAAAPMHVGDNFQDQSGVGKADFFNARSQQFLAAIEHMVSAWDGRGHVDSQRIGAFGMSMGGFTVLTAIGAQPDLRRIAAHCGKVKEFACDVLRHFKSPYVDGAPRAGSPFAADLRIRAAVLAAPGLGFTMTPQSLGAVRVPIQLWTGANDSKVSEPGPVRALGALVEHHRVAGAEHMSFLAPCSGLLRPPEICSDPDGFDRAAFHRTMNARVVAFFDKHLQAASASQTHARAALTVQ